jgi:hypothetical protein
MRNLYPALLKSLQLSGGFSLDLIRTKLAKKNGQGEIVEFDAKLGIVASRLEQAWHTSRREYRRSIQQDHMTSNAYP